MKNPDGLDCNSGDEAFAGSTTTTEKGMYRFGGLVPPPPPNCDLVIDETCRVETETSSGGLECGAKIAATALRDIGQSDPGEVTVTDKFKNANAGDFDGEAKFAEGCQVHL